MSDNYKVMVSGNIGEGLYVLRGDNAAELVEQSKALADNLSEILENLGVAKQAVLAKEAFTAKKFAKDAAPAGAAKATGGSYNKGASVTDSPDGGKVCDHGAMKLLDYVKKTDGSRVHGYYCQAPRGGKQCPAVKL